MRAFGFDVPALRPGLFLEADRIVRTGHPPLRVELMTSSGRVEFEECYRGWVVDELGGVNASIFGLECLETNKRASRQSTPGHIGVPHNRSSGVDAKDRIGFVYPEKEAR